MQVSVLAMALCVSLLGLLVQYAPKIYFYQYYSVAGLSFSENARRLNLIEQSINDPEILSSLSSDEIELVLQKPSLVRQENTVQAWHYHGDSCAIDIYFKDLDDKPDYIEFRALTLNNSVQEQFKDADQGYVNQYCLKGVLAAQGVETPNSYAARPLPSWTSPYSS